MVDKKKAMIAGVWIILVYGFSQIFRLASNLIVTRILEPEMFGVMAVVYVIHIGIDMFSDVGLWAYVVRQKNSEDKHMLNVVWSMQVVRGWLIFLVISIIMLFLLVIQNKYSFLVSGVYSDNRLPLLIMLTGTASIINGYKSLASPVISKKMIRGKLELVDLSAQVTGVLFMLVWIWFFPNIWGLVSAGIVSAIVGCVLSYKVFNFKHHFVWDKVVIRDVMHFGKWITVSSALSFLFMQGDKLYLGAKISANELGVYSIAFMLTSTFVSVLNTLASKIAFPSFSQLAHGPREYLKSRYYKVKGFIELPVYFCCGILLILAPHVISFLYDSRYQSAGAMMQIMVLYIIGASMTMISLEVLSSLAITKVNMWVMLTRTIILFVSMPIAFHYFGLHGVIWAISLNVWSAIPIVFWNLKKNNVFSIVKEVRMLVLVPIGYQFAKFVLMLLN